MTLNDKKRQTLRDLRFLREDTVSPPRSSERGKSRKVRSPMARILRVCRKRFRVLKARTSKKPRYTRRLDPEERRKRISDRLNPKAPKETSKIDEHELIRRVCKRDFFEFVKEFWDVVSQEEPVWNWHIEYLCGEIQKMAERVFKGETKEYDLVINIPPGTTKSTICSVMLPAWVWTRFPRGKFIGASYSESLARDDLSLKTRDIVTSQKYTACFPEIQIRRDQGTKGYFQNTSGGWRYAVGVNGSVTGKHAHFIVIDDPLNPNEAFSAADLKSANRWISETLSNRKVDKRTTVTILVMQRLHQDDPTARFLTKKNVRHIRLPAEVEDEPLPKELERFYVDTLLDPIRLDLKAIAEAKAEGDAYFASQFRQMPVPPGGAKFKVNRIKRDSTPLKWRKLVRFWDKAGTTGGGDWTVGTLMGLDYEGRFWVLDVVRFRLDSHERDKMIQKVAQMDGKVVVIGLEQEGGSGGKQSAEYSAKRLAGYITEIVKVGASEGSKVDRADPFSSQVNSGNVHIPNHQWEGGEDTGHWIDWAAVWVEEFKYFPASRYKDQVDSASGAFSIVWRPMKTVGGMRKIRREMREGKNGYLLAV